MQFKKDNIYVEIYLLPYIIVNIKIHFSNTEINFVLREYYSSEISLKTHQILPYLTDIDCKQF